MKTIKIILQSIIFVLSGLFLKAQPADPTNIGIAYNTCGGLDMTRDASSGAISYEADIYVIGWPNSILI